MARRYLRALVGHPLDGLLTLTGDTFSSNSATTESGAIDNWAGGTVTVTDDSITGNSAPYGGAIGNEWGSVAVSNSTFSNNTASTGAGGAIINYNPNDDFTNSMSVVGSTISGNAAVNGGGIANSGPDTLSLTNETITGNSVTASGGGLYDNGTTTLINCTITGNSAASGGGIANVGGTIIIANTIVAENTATTGGPDAAGRPRYVPGPQPDRRDRRQLRMGRLRPDRHHRPAAGPPVGPIGQLRRADAHHSLAAWQSCHQRRRGGPRPDHRSAGRAPATGECSHIGAFEFALTNVADPMVVSLKRFGYHDHPTVLVLTFSEPMDAAQADNLANYRLVVAVPDHRPGVEDGRAIRVRRALYDAANQTVTLWPIRRLPLRRTFLLTVKGTPPGGLTNASGTFLDGAGTGQTGSDFMGIVNRKSLAGQTRLH